MPSSSCQKAKDTLNLFQEPVIDKKQNTTADVFLTFLFPLVLAGVAILLVREDIGLMNGSGTGYHLYIEEQSVAEIGGSGMVVSARCLAPGGCLWKMRFNGEGIRGVDEDRVQHRDVREIHTIS